VCAVLARSVRNPLILGVGAGAVLVIGTAPAALAVIGDGSSPSPTASDNAPKTPTPDPSTSTETPPPPGPPTLTAAFTHFPGLVRPGTNYSIDVVVTPHFPSPKSDSPKNLALTLRGSRAAVTCVASKSRVYEMGSTVRNAKIVAITVSVPSDVTSGYITVTAHVDADNADWADAKPLTIKVKKPASTTSSNSGSTNSGGGSSSGSGGGSTSTTSNLPTGTTTPPVTTTPPPNASLPDLTQPTPTTAPVQNTGSSQSMRSTGDEADQLTFDKLASTQAAWLAALLVAFSLLLTQARLGRTNKRDPKIKGNHRRARRPGRAH
jgi:hypothetical protein